jgi:hypothetical protein
MRLEKEKPIWVCHQEGTRQYKAQEASFKDAFISVFYGTQDLIQEEKKALLRNPSCFFESESGKKVQNGKKSKDALIDFINHMSIGDYVIIPQENFHASFIAEITGNPEYYCRNSGGVHGEGKYLSRQIKPIEPYREKRKGVDLKGSGLVTEMGENWAQNTVYKAEGMTIEKLEELFETSL